MKKYLHSSTLLLEKYKHAVVALILTAIIADILAVEFQSYLISLPILAFTIVFFNFYKFSSKKIFLLCFIPILVIFFGYIIAPESLQIKKAATWLFLFMTTGIIWEILKIFKNEKI